MLLISSTENHICIFITCKTLGQWRSSTSGQLSELLGGYELQQTAKWIQSQSFAAVGLWDFIDRQRFDVAGSSSDGVIGIFHWLNPTRRTMALRWTQPLTEMSTRDFPWVVKTAGA
jgi:hypothetical protein